MREFRMPSLGADMTAGTLAKWHVAAGTPVHRGMVVCDVETDKGIIEVDVLFEGTVTQLLVREGERVPVGTTLAIFDVGAAAGRDATEQTTTPDAARAAPAAPIAGRSSHVPVPTAIEPHGIHATPSARQLAHQHAIDLHGVRPTGPHALITRADVLASVEAAHTRTERKRIWASPRARRRAAELGMDLRALVPSGPDGSIVERDVLSALGPVAEPPPAQTLPGPRKPATMASGWREAVARATARSKREIPHFYLSTKVDMTNAERFLETVNADRPASERVLAGVLFVKAVALAARKVPELNARFESESPEIAEDVHVGMAISLRGGGLVAPALLDADRKDLETLGREAFDLVDRARRGTLRSSEMSAPTITVTSLGDRGVETIVPVIIAPQTAIVGFGTIVSRPWVVGDAVLPRPIVEITLAADHRVAGGREGSLFLRTVTRYLHDPARAEDAVSP